MTLIINRRTATQAVIASLFSTPRSARAADEKEYPANRASRIQWFEAATATKGLVGRLNVSKFLEQIYFLLDETRWVPPKKYASQFKDVVVPRGFVTDLASIPAVFFSVLPKDAEYAHPAVIHDYLYWDQSTSRADADLIFKIAMEELEVGPKTVEAIYRAVSLFGGSTWKENAALRASGERRVLIKIPTVADVRWSAWKTRPDVFGGK